MGFTARLDNLSNTVANGAAGWWNNSAVTWICSAGAYYGVKLATEHPSLGLKGWDPAETAKTVAVFCSLYAIITGCSTEPTSGKVDPNVAEAEERKKWLIQLTNTAAFGLAVNRYLGIKLDPLYAAGLSILLRVPATMIYNKIYQPKAPTV